MKPTQLALLATLALPLLSGCASKRDQNPQAQNQPARIQPGFPQKPTPQQQRPGLPQQPQDQFAGARPGRPGRPGGQLGAFPGQMTPPPRPMMQPPVPGGVAPATGGGTSDGLKWTRANVAGPYIAMTFDDGPSPANTPRLLDMLAQRGIKATFFMVGQNVAAYPALLRRMVAEGHEVANHSWSHPSLPGLGAEGAYSQIKRTHDAIIAACGVTPRIMRPPYGAVNSTLVQSFYQNFGYRTILWDIDPLDWKKPGADALYQRIVPVAHSGSIILAHDIHASTVDAMPRILDGLIARGYRFVTVSQLLSMHRGVTAPQFAMNEQRPPAPGQQQPPAPMPMMPRQQPMQQQPAAPRMAPAPAFFNLPGQQRPPSAPNQSSNNNNNTDVSAALFMKGQAPAPQQ